MLSRLDGGASQGGDAGGGLRSADDLEQPPGDAEADALGLSDGGEVVVDFRREDDSVLEPVVEGLDLSVLPVELLLEPVDPSYGGVAVDGLDDVVSFAVEGLSRLVAVFGHRGDVAIAAAKDGKGTGDPLGDGGHGKSIRRGQREVTPTIAHAPRGIVQKNPTETDGFEIVPALLARPLHTTRTLRLGQVLVEQGDHRVQPEQAGGGPKNRLAAPASGRLQPKKRHASPEMWSPGSSDRSRHAIIATAVMLTSVLKKYSSRCVPV